MPIYAYKCDACGHAKDVLQKMSDPQLTECPSCGQAAFKKQLTAAGFQLKGTGWYVTDFREGGGKNSVPAVDAKSSDTPITGTTSAPAPEKAVDSGASASAMPSAAPAASTATPAASPAPSA